VSSVRSEIPLDHTTPKAGSNAASGAAIVRDALIIAGLFSLALNILVLTVPLYMTAIYDRVLSSYSFETLIMLTIIAVGALIVAGILDVVRQIILTRAGARLETQLGGPLLDATLAAARTGGGEVQALRDLSQVRQFLSSPVVGALFDAPVTPLYLALLFVLHPDLGWIALGIAVFLFLVSVANQRMTNKVLGEANLHQMAAFQQAQTQVRNAETVRAMGMFDACIQAWGGENAKAMTASDRAARINAVFAGITRFTRLMLQVAMLGWGAYLVLYDNAISAGIIFAASIISGRALAPIDQILAGWRSLVSAQLSWKRVNEMLKMASRQTSAISLPDPVGSLEAERLVYSAFPGQEPIIKGVSFLIDPGEIVGVVGPTGAGKSTLARLLVGALKPSSGLVRIGGDDISHWRAEALGPFIGYVPQDVELFPGTVAANIARMADIDSEKVIDAAQLANCHELIQKLPKGYDTILGPGGQMLSGGQRQRIALARAFYGNPRVLVLDEPNASLDIDGEEALLRALQAAKAAGITCFVITQRTSVLPALTKMMVIQDGRVQSFGPRDEFMQSQIRAAAKGPASPSVSAGAPADGASFQSARTSAPQFGGMMYPGQMHVSLKPDTTGQAAKPTTVRPRKS